MRTHATRSSGPTVRSCCWPMRAGCHGDRVAGAARADPGARLHRFRSAACRGWRRQAFWATARGDAAWLAAGAGDRLDPHTVGVQSAVWTTRLLADYLERVTGIAGIEAVRVHLHRWLRLQRHLSLKRSRRSAGGYVRWGHPSGCGIARPPPMLTVPDPLLPSEELPEDLPCCCGCCPGRRLPADEVEVALHPTLTRVWCRRRPANAS